MKTIVLRCARMSSRIRGWIAGQMLVRSLAADGRAAGLLVRRQDLAEARHVLDRDDDLELERLARAGVDDRDLAARPDPAEEPGDRLERPLGRATGRSAASGSAPSRSGARRRSRRSRLRARWAPRFVPAIAWTSSTITVLDAAEDLARLRW